MFTKFFIIVFYYFWILCLLVCKTDKRAIRDLSSMGFVAHVAISEFLLLIYIILYNKENSNNLSQKINLIKVNGALLRSCYCFDPKIYNIYILICLKYKAA